MLDLINELNLAFMVSSPVKTKIHIIAFQEIFNRVTAVGNPPISMLFDFEVAAINYFLKYFQNLA